MNTLAHGFADGDGPGPWILLFPLMWALVVGGAVFLLSLIHISEPTRP